MPVTPLDESRDPWDLLDAARTVLTVHAHPDDESLSTGTLLAHLAARGAKVVLVTATRGEEGETIPGSIPAGDARPFDEVRMAELDGAAASLGIARRHLLGTPPALAAGAAPRRYRDSGMRWVTPQIAGPAEGTGPDAFTRRPREEALADLVTAIEHERPDVLVSYDDGGTYGHPDHVLVHELTAAASMVTGVPFIEVESYHEEGRGAADDSFAARDLPETAAAVRGALDSHRTQLSLLAPDERSDSIGLRLSGGQERRLPLRVGVRVHRTS